jgi:uroporphyrinogen decarboxylase
MRQAGRYLPEYREIRAKTDFISLCKNPKLACQVSRQPVDIVGVDAAIIFSDILIPLEPMGFKLTIEEGIGPRLPNALGDNIKTLSNLRAVDPDQSLDFVGEAISLLKAELPDEIPVIGFAGAPWTLATYAIEGKTGKTFETSKKWLFCEPEAFQELLNKLVEVVAQHLALQIRSGASVVQLFDSWAGALTPTDFQRVALPAAAKVFKRLKEICKEPYYGIYFPKGAYASVNEFPTSFENQLVDGIGIDWGTPLDQARKKLSNRFCLQGNLDPAQLFASPEVVREKTKEMLEIMRDKDGNFRNAIANLGHGVLPKTPVASVKAFVETVKSYG